MPRSLFIAAAGLTLLGVAGCAGTSPGGTPPPSSPSTANALAKLDPCSLLKPADANSLGISGQGHPPIVSVPGQAGCDYESNSESGFSLTIYIDPENTVESSQQQNQTTHEWATFNRLDINGRTGATGISSGSTHAQICNAMFDAGPGTIIAQAEERDPSAGDGCNDALKAAKLIEPNAPK